MLEPIYPLDQDKKDIEARVELKIYKLDIDFGGIFDNWYENLREIEEMRAKKEEVARELKKQKTLRWRIKNRFKKNKIPKAKAKSKWKLPPKQSP